MKKHKVEFDWNGVRYISIGGKKISYYKTSFEMNQYKTKIPISEEEYQEMANKRAKIFN